MRIVAPSYLFLLAFSATGAIGTWFGIAPLIRSTNAVQQQLAAVRAASDSTQVISSPAQVSQQFSSDSSLALALLPTTDNQYYLISQLNTAFAAQNLPLNALTVSPNGSPVDVPALNSNIKTVAISFSTTGSFTSIQQMIDKLAELDRYLTVTQVTMTSSASGVVIATLTAQAYYLTPQ